jgi:P4 family phage/plasmid primase-like protien
MADGDSVESLPSAKRRRSPAALVASLLEHAHLVTDNADTVFRWNGAYYEELSESTLRQIALEADHDGRSTRARRAEMIDEIRARTHQRELAWGRVGDHEMPFKNGVLDVLTGAIKPHRPEDYLERVLPWSYDAQARAPVWEATLASWFGDGESAEAPIKALQEFFGYACLSHAKYKKALLVYGKSDTGKSLIPFLLAHMVGRERTCSLPLEQMDDPQARAVIVGKALNLLTEISTSSLIADGGFKTMISTEEPILVNAKYKPPFSYYPTAKHVFTTNNMPGLSDRTEAVLNRLLIVPMTRVFAKDEQDEFLPAKLEAEIGGVLAWAVLGAKRLVEQHGKFTGVDEGAALLDELRRRANPAIDFVQERLTPSETAAIPLEHLVDRFNQWKRGSKVTTKGLGAMLRAAGKTVKHVRHGRRVITSLVGFELVSGDLPTLMMVSPEDAASPETEIKSTGAIEPGPV